MQVTVKSVDALVKDGWELNRKSIYKYLSKDEGKIALTRAFVDRACGKTGYVTDIDSGYNSQQDVMNAEVVIDGFRFDKINTYVFEKFDAKKYRLQKMYLDKEKLTWNGFSFRFGCHRNVSAEDAVEAAQWVLKCVKGR